MAEELKYITWFVLLLLGGYVAVRLWASAYFRTRREHVRDVMRDITKGDSDG